MNDCLYFSNIFQPFETRNVYLCFYYYYYLLILILVLVAVVVVILLYFYCHIRKLSEGDFDWKAILGFTDFAFSLAHHIFKYSETKK